MDIYDDEEESDFECPECGEEPDEDDVCQNEECPCFGEEPDYGAMSDSQLRQEERRQMGIGS